MDPKHDLHKLGMFPDSKLGQNFLVDRAVIEKTVEAAHLTDGDTVIEIGPGLGAITHYLSQSAGKVIGIEIDRDLAEFLRGKSYRHTTIVTGDALNIDWTVTLEGPYKIVANIPYSITSPLIKKIIGLQMRPELIVLITQKEFAERLTAPADSSERGALTVTVEATFEATKLFDIPAMAFYPPPKVESAVLVLKPREDVRGKIYWPIVDAGFSQKRQKLTNCLKNRLQISKDVSTRVLKDMGLDEGIRAEDLTLEDWIELSEQLKG